MTQRLYTFFVALITLGNWAIWLIILIYLNPQSPDKAVFIFFYLGMFLSLFGTIYFFNYFLHSKIFHWTSFKNIQVSTRQSILLSLLLVSSLVLQSKRTLTWYNLLLIVVILTLIEFIFLSKKSHYARK